MKIHSPESWRGRLLPTISLLATTLALLVSFPSLIHATPTRIAATPTPPTIIHTDSDPQPSISALLQTLPAKNPQLEAWRNATFLLGEGDRLNQAGKVEEARQKWLHARTIYQQAESGMGIMQVSERLEESYIWEAYRTFDTEKAQLGISYAQEGIRAGADVYERLIQEYRTYDQTVLNQAKTQYNQAIDQCTAGHYQQGLALLQKAQRLYHSIDFTVGELRVVAQRGDCQLNNRDLFGSLLSMLEALELTQELPNGDATSALAFQGQDQYAQGDWQGALATFQAVLKHRQAENNQAGMGNAYSALGDVYEALGDYPAAKVHYQKALAITITLKNEYAEYNEAVTRYNLANIATVTGQYAEAIAGYTQVIQLWQQLGKPFQEAVGLNALAVALQGQARYSDALAAIERATTIYQKLTPDPIFEAYLSNNRGSINFSLGNYAEATQRFQAASALLQKEPAQRYQATQVQVNLAGVASALGRFDEAMALYQPALAFAEQKKMVAFAAQVRFNIASVQLQQDDYQTALAAFVQVLPIFEQYQMALDEARTLQNMGAAYMKMGDLAEGEIYLQKALTRFQTIGGAEYIPTVQNNLGALAFLAYAWEKAKKYYNDALTTWKAQNNQMGISRALNNLSLVAGAQHDFPLARQYGEAALTASQQAQTQADQVKILFSLGGIYLALGLDQRAEASAQAGLKLAAQIGDPLTAMGGHVILALSALKRNDMAVASQQIQTSLDLLEGLQGSLTVPELKSAFLDQTADVYAIAAFVAFRQGQTDLAFRYTEQSRARAFLDQLGNRRLNIPQGDTPLIRQEAALRQRIAQLQTKLRNEAAQSLQRSPAESLRLSQELETARRDYASLLTQLKAAAPEYASLITVAPLTLQEVQTQVLDEKTTLVVYFVFRELVGDQTFAWVIDRQQAKLVPLNVSEKTLTTQIKFARQAITDHPFDPQTVAQLYEELFAPLKPFIHHPNLLIVPHRSIHYLPFAALWDAKTQRFLLQDYTITYAPSASALKLIQAKRNPNANRLLAMGNPSQDLTYAGDEAKQVASLYGVKPLTGTAASESQLYAQAAHIDLLHIAAHGVYNPISPLFTRIELAPDAMNDGNLEVHEVFGLDLTGVNLVVLSACKTDLGEQSNGDEIVNLTRAFLYAGAPSIVTSLWSVNDQATAVLMSAFYAHLRTGMSVANALRSAQLEVFSKKQWSSPSYWAAFNLNGDYLGRAP